MNTPRSMQTTITILLVSIFILINKTSTNAQTSTEVIPVFWGERLVDKQTTQVLPKNAVKIEILHRFGEVKNGVSDLFGIYAPSNISMGIAYGITANLLAEFQTEKNHKIQEFGFKYNILNQTMSGQVPFNLSYYANVGIDARNQENFGPGYTFTDRLLFTNEIIFSRQFKYKYFMLLSLGYVHFNAIEKTVQHDKLEAHISAGYKITPQHSLFLSYMHPWDVHLFHANRQAMIQPKPGVTLGYESSTPSHNFQVFLTNRDNIIMGKDLIFNNDISLQSLRVGFNIRVYLWRNYHEK